MQLLHALKDKIYRFALLLLAVYCSALLAHSDFQSQPIVRTTVAEDDMDATDDVGSVPPLEPELEPEPKLRAQPLQRHLTI